MEILLRLKHWQIFMLTFGILIVSALIQGVEATISPYGVLMNRVTELVSVLITIAWCLWAYIVGIKLSEKRPHGSFNEGLFKFCLILLGVFSAMETLLFPIMNVTLGELGWLYTTLNLAVGIYADYTLAKVLTSVERSKETTFGEFVGDFLLIVFYPIGIWWIQPRINNLFGSVEEIIDPDTPLDHNLNR